MVVEECKTHSHFGRYFPVPEELCSASMILILCFQPVHWQYAPGIRWCQLHEVVMNDTRHNHSGCTAPNFARKDLFYWHIWWSDTTHTCWQTGWWLHTALLSLQGRLCKWDMFEWTSQLFFLALRWIVVTGSVRNRGILHIFWILLWAVWIWSASLYQLLDPLSFFFQEQVELSKPGTSCQVGFFIEPC